jgi:S1-C subfamily serine protease
LNKKAATLWNVRAFALTGAILLGSSFALFAQRVSDPAQATVFIRVIGTVEVEVGSALGDREVRNVEFGTGSGFVFTPYGHVLTNYHVVEGGSLTGRLPDGQEVRLDLSVERIEVVLPREGEGAGARLEASLEVQDAELDLAVLSVASADLPYLGLGDSDAAEPGEEVRVFGFPFGSEVEVGKTNLPDIVPSVSVTKGSFSAARGDDLGNTAFLQTSATVNPGNSGGPMVDREGFVLGVVRLKLRDGDGIGFAIPVNSVKDFLEVRGYGSLLPVERLRLGSEQSLEGKGLRLSLPDTMEDRSQARLLVRSDPESAVQFASDRVATPWDLARLEELLLSGVVFGAFRAGGEKETSVLEGGRLILGRANGYAGDQEGKIEYALFENGEEKVVVRYTGPVEAVAFNRSVLKGSLASLRVDSLLDAPVASAISADGLRWGPQRFPEPSAPPVVLPERGWEQEVSAPFPCRALPPADSALAASPRGDFTVSLRAAWFRSAPPPVEAARSCSRRPGLFGEASYAYALEWLGVAYQVSGIFAEVEEGLLQLEVVSPREKEGFVRELAARFFEANR